MKRNFLILYLLMRVIIIGIFDKKNSKKWEPYWLIIAISIESTPSQWHSTSSPLSTHIQSCIARLLKMNLLDWAQIFHRGTYEKSRYSEMPLETLRRYLILPDPVKAKTQTEDSLCYYKCLSCQPTLRDLHWYPMKNADIDKHICICTCYVALF